MNQGWNARADGWVEDAGGSSMMTPSNVACAELGCPRARPIPVPAPRPRSHLRGGALRVYVAITALSASPRLPSAPRPLNPALQPSRWFPPSREA